MGEEVFANLVEQGPQFWLDYEQYRQARAKSAQAQAVMEHETGAQDPADEQPAHPAAG
jgi:hypothetical protein